MITVSCLVLLDSQNTFLATQRPLHKSLGGLWEFPGGKVEQGESPEEALRRELREELHLSEQSHLVRMERPRSWNRNSSGPAPRRCSEALRRLVLRTDPEFLKKAIRVKAVAEDPAAYGLTEGEANSLHYLFWSHKGEALGVSTHQESFSRWQQNRSAAADFISPTTRYKRLPDQPDPPPLGKPGRYHSEQRDRPALYSLPGTPLHDSLLRPAGERDQGCSSTIHLAGSRLRSLSYKSDRPIQMVWELKHPMPAELFQAARTT